MAPITANSCSCVRAVCSCCSRYSNSWWAANAESRRVDAACKKVMVVNDL